MADFSATSHSFLPGVLIADEIDMYSDASGKIGMGAVCGASWMYQVWDEKFIRKHKPSIEYLELYAVTAAVIAWIHRFRNKSNSVL